MTTVQGIPNSWARLTARAVLLATIAMAGAPASIAAPPVTTGPLSIPFPRLGMWWPDPWTQPLASIARYDFVNLFDFQRGFIPAIRARRPGITLLNATNACELDFDGSPGAPAWANEAQRKIPPQWFLTQVGTTLTAPVDATTTTFHVAEVTTSTGSFTIELFIPTDTALIDGESVYIDAVDTVSCVLTVRRGYARPAAAHAAGTRVAALITFWPGSWLLNVSTFCPRASAAGSTVTETWAEYNARIAAGLIGNAAWDGILLDRSDPNESWLIGNSTARTIDPDQSNTLLTDYSGFDAAWNAGLRIYESNLRAAIGDNRIIFVNWGMANYDLLNGNNYETFPMTNTTAYGTPWNTAVIGPEPRRGSYFEWIEKARQPNITMIETYEDDGGPLPTGDGSYDNPFNHPGFVPNYRKMRFGLATALLNDGFFSYEINTNGHGMLGLMWFDEYDNAGHGRGYLGLPVGPATHAIPSLTAPNLARGGSFETSADFWLWSVWGDTGYVVSAVRDTTTASVGTASARISVTQSGGTDWKAMFSQGSIPVTEGSDYTFTFWAKADRERPISVWVQEAQAPWRVWISSRRAALTPDWKQFELLGHCDGSDSAARLNFGVGETTGTVWLDDIRPQAGNRDVWRRDYAGGRVLLNATTTTQTVQLGEWFRKIQGTQAPDINDGSHVRQIDLPPHDGLILLRETPSAADMGWLDAD